MKFFIEASYSAEGAKGVLTNGGGSDRKKMTETMISHLGGKMANHFITSIIVMPMSSASYLILQPRQQLPFL